MPEFRPHPQGATLLLDTTETAILRQLVAELRALLTGRRPKGDPVLDRLLPAAYEDVEEEAAYRDMVDGALVQEKVRALDLLSEKLAGRPEEVTLTGEEFDTWLAALTDLRLAMGTRLGVDEERMSGDIEPTDPDAQALAVLHWLGWMQEGLLQAHSG